MPLELSQVADPEEMFHVPWGPQGDAESAAVWLAGRARARTPRGAAEFLTMCRTDYASRVRSGLTILSLYERLFPKEYANSTRPPFTTERETEFYHLVNERKFPVDLTPCYKHPNWVYLWIPIRCVQKYDFILGPRVPFEQWPQAFQLIIALCNTFKRADWWPRLARLHGLPERPRPRDWETVSVNRFAELCIGEPNPLNMLPAAFLVVSYRTGNLFLDSHPLNPTYKALNACFEWNVQNVETLAAHWREGKQIITKIAALSAWLAQSPAERMSRAVELWNAAEGEWEL
jgi:hypothetical protein